MGSSSGAPPSRTCAATGRNTSRTPLCVAGHLNRVAKRVRLGDPRGPRTDGTTVLRGPPEDEIRALKGAEGTDIVVTGSIPLCHGPIDADLVDEYRLFTQPHVEGRGRRLPENRMRVPALHPAARRRPAPQTVSPQGVNVER